jgi:hypothetical protein
MASMADNCGCLPPQKKADLEAMIENPTSDLSQLNEEDLDITGEMSAQFFLKKNPKFSGDIGVISDIGEAMASRHNLYGDQAYFFYVRFSNLLKALLDNPNP